MPIYVGTAHGVKDVDAGLSGQGRQLIPASHKRHGSAALKTEQGGDMAFGNRIEGVTAKNTFVYGNVLDVLNAAAGHTVHVRQSGQKAENPFPAAVQHGAEFSAHVAPERRVGLFEDALHAGADSVLGKGTDDPIGFLSRDMTGGYAKNKNLRIRLGKCIRFYLGKHLGAGAGGGQLYAGVQSPGKIVCDDQ